MLDTTRNAANGKRNDLLSESVFRENEEGSEWVACRTLNATYKDPASVTVLILSNVDRVTVRVISEWR
jgi:hypothetical protein